MSEFIKLEESASRTLLRIYDYSNHSSIFILTAHRGFREKSFEGNNIITVKDLATINNIRNNQLESAISSLRLTLGAGKLSYIKVFGSCLEENAEGTKTQVYEKSFLLIVDESVDKEVFKFIIEQGENYNQDFVFVKLKSDQNAYLYKTNNSILLENKQQNLGTFTQSTANDYFTRFNTRTDFTFESVEIQAPQNALGHLAMSRKTHI